MTTASKPATKSSKPATKSSTAKNAFAPKATVKSPSKLKKTAEPIVEPIVAPVAEPIPAPVVEAPAPVAAIEKKQKDLAPSDKIALKVVAAIRADRSQFNKSFEMSEDGNIATHSYIGRIGSAVVSFGRHEVAGKKTREIIARAFIHIKPADSDKHLEITGHMAARAWYAMHNAPKGHTKSQPDVEAIAAAEAALGL